MGHVDDTWSRLTVLEQAKRIRDYCQGINCDCGKCILLGMAGCHGISTFCPGNWTFMEDGWLKK